MNLTRHDEPYDSWHNRLDRLWRARGEIVAALFVIAAVIGLIWLAVMICMSVVENSRKWEQYKVDHHCVVVSHVSGDTIPTTVIQANGQVGIGFSSTPSKTGYKCDDGVTYWR